MSNDEKIVGSDRVIAVLVELSKHEAGVTLDELTNTMGYPKPTIHRALASLKKAGLAHQANRGVYTLGDEFLRMAFRFQNRRPEAVQFDAALHALAQEFGETVHLATLDGRDVVYRGKVDSPSGAVKLTSSIGARNPAYSTAVGKLLLSYKFDSESAFLDWLGDAKLEKKTDTTITDPKKLWKEIVNSRKRDYGIDNQENEVGVNCLAIPVFTTNSKVPYGAISISGLSFRTPIEILETNVEKIRSIISANAI